MKSKVVKRVLSVALALTMMAGLMTGCGSSANETAAEPAVEAEVEEEAPAEEAPAEEAAEEDVMSGDPVELRMIMYGDMTTRRDEFFKNEFHDAVLADLNIDLSIEMLPWGSDKTTVSTMLASGEDFAVYCILANYD